MNAHLKKLLITASSTLLLTSLAPVTQAKKGDDDRQGDRVVFQGIVQSKPLGGLHGTWRIAGKTVRTHAGTQFDQLDGRLQVGVCAKVKLRNGKVHEIDSEPAHDC
ncbi:hypothetical protein [uncultured Thiothrix sp.]|uniref:hypothetical protein n=1 Tax=uncultured Thiothrix sp. TaxID=223185 RepID=UPI002624F392|nr:hypothetical protein [uncultured Thiothrix sp.]